MLISKRRSIIVPKSNGSAVITLSRLLSNIPSFKVRSWLNNVFSFLSSAANNASRTQKHCTIEMYNIAENFCVSVKTKILQSKLSWIALVQLFCRCGHKILRRKLSRMVLKLHKMWKCSPPKAFRYTVRVETFGVVLFSVTSVAKNLT